VEGQQSINDGPIDRLPKERVASSHHGLSLHLVTCHSCNGNHEKLVRFGQAPKLACNIAAVRVGQKHVDKHDVRAKARSNFQGSTTVDCELYLVAHLTKHDGKGLCRIEIVLNDEDSLHV
jgi:hypothetical protein